MTKLYRRISLAFATAAALAVSGLVAAPAQAADPALFCQVIPSRFPPRTPFCGTLESRSSWLVDFFLVNGPTTGLTWNVHDGYPTAGDGCVSTTPYCDVPVRRSSVEQRVVADVSFLDANGRLVTLTATAIIPQFCGSLVC